MKKINIKSSLCVLLLLIAFGSCKKEANPGGTAVQSLSGEWWVKLDNGKDATGTFGPDYYSFTTYNTAANKPDSMWVDDDASQTTANPFWDIKGKVGTNVSNNTFSGNAVANQDYISTFTITNGKVLPNAARAPGSGDKTDSIYFEIKFSDDPVPSTIHKVGGYKRTGFGQDDHYKH
jgi:hypothetical protein